MIELYINGQLVDIDPSEVIACTYQRNDIGDLKDRQADYTNEFNLPLTSKNKIIFGNPDIVQTYSVKSYKNNTARLVRYGVEIISSGVAVFKNSSIDGFVSVVVYSGIFDLFARLGDKTLKDLNTEDLSHFWNVTTASASAGNYEGVIYPLIKTDFIDISDSIWNVGHQVPSVFVRTLFERIITQAGYKFKGQFFQNPSYTNMILPCLDTFERDEQWIKDRSSFVTIKNYVGEAVPDPSGGNFYGKYYDGEFGYQFVPFDVDYEFQKYANESKEFFDGAKNNYESSFFGYVANEAMTLKVELQTALGVVIPVFGSYRYYVCVMKNNFAFDCLTEDFNDGAFSQRNYSWNIHMNAGDYIQIQHSLVKTGGVGQGALYFHTQKNFVKYTPSKIIPINSFLDIPSVIPPIKQRDFVKAILQLFAVTIQNDNYSQVLNFTTFKEMVEKDAIDWSIKLDTKREIKVSYRFDGYSQENKLVWAKNDKDTTYGNGVINIDDETLDKSSNAIELPFASTIEGNLFPELFKVADIPLFNAAGERQKVEPRLLMINRNQSWIGLELMDGINGNITINGNYPFAYFTRAGNKGLHFETDLIPEYYKSIEEVLNKCKIVTCYLDLQESDIQALDFSVPVYIEYFNARFYINKVEEYTGNESTRCELIRL
jgi:hypothetical protein